MREFLTGGNIWVAISTIATVISVTYNIYQGKTIKDLKKGQEIHLKYSGYVGHKAKAGEIIAGRDIKK